MSLACGESEVSRGSLGRSCFRGTKGEEIDGRGGAEILTTDPPSPPVAFLGSGSHSVITFQLACCSVAFSPHSLAWDISGTSMCSGTLCSSRYEPPPCSQSPFPSKKDPGDLPTCPQVMAHSGCEGLLPSPGFLHYAPRGPPSPFLRSGLCLLSKSALSTTLGSHEMPGRLGLGGEGSWVKEKSPAAVRGVRGRGVLCALGAGSEQGAGSTAQAHPTCPVSLQICNGLAQTTGWPAVVSCVGNWFGKGK